MHDIFTSAAPASGYTLSDFLPKRMVLSPTHWREFTSTENLEWQAIQFNRKNLNIVPDDQKGVYTFVIRPGIANHPQCAYLM